MEQEVLAVAKGRASLANKEAEQVAAACAWLNKTHVGNQVWSNGCLQSLALQELADLRCLAMQKTPSLSPPACAACGGLEQGVLAVARVARPGGP